MNKNLKKVIAPVAAAAMVFAVPTGVYAEDGAQEKITFCLDWTPNTNHTGLYVAQAKGYYEEAGLDVEIVQPPENGAALMCAAGQAQFAIEAQDTMAASLALDEPLGITAVAGIIQHNTSGILSRKGDGIDKPAGLTGKTYSTWDSPIELAMLENVVNGDGGDFSQVTLIPNDITDEPAALAANQTDAIWVFQGWGGINADVEGVDCDYLHSLISTLYLTTTHRLSLQITTILLRTRIRRKHLWKQLQRDMSLQQRIRMRQHRSSLTAIIQVL